MVNRRDGVTANNRSEKKNIVLIRCLAVVAYVFCYFSFFFTYRSIYFDDFKIWKFVFAAFTMISLVAFGILYVKELAHGVINEFAGIIYFIIAVAISTFLTKTCRIYFLWDTHDMFRLIDAADVYSLFDFKELSLSHHISYSFSFVCIVFKLIFGSAVEGQAFVGYMLYFIGVYGFYKCCTLFLIYGITSIDSKVNRNCRNTILRNVILTVIYGVSPYMLGMITYSYPDYAVWCMTPLLTYLILKKKYEISVIVATFYVFTKETAVISYFYFVLGVYIVEAIQKKKLIHSFVEYAAYALPCLIWNFSYNFVDHWNGGGMYGVVPEYISSKLASYFFINYNYVLVVMATVSVIWVMVKKQGVIFVFPLMLSGVAYTIFSVLFLTVIHPRYIDSLIAQLYLLTAFCTANCIGKKVLQYLINAALIIVLFLQSFITIDPVMLNTYDKLNIGTKTMVTTSEILSDGMAYNRQYQYWGRIIDIAIEDVVEDDTAVLFMPAVYNDTWHFDAMGHYIPLNGAQEVTVPEEWDVTKKTRMTSAYGDTKAIDIVMISDDYVLDLGEGIVGYYLYTNYAGQNIAEIIKHNYKYEEVQISYKGFIVTRIKFY